MCGNGRMTGSNRSRIAARRQEEPQPGGPMRQHPYGTYRAFGILVHAAQLPDSVREAAFPHLSRRAGTPRSCAMKGPGPGNAQSGPAQPATVKAAAAGFGAGEMRGAADGQVGHFTQHLSEMTT